MSTGPGRSDGAPKVASEAAPRALVGGAKVAAVLVALAPWLAALYAGLQTFLFVAGLETPPLQRATHVALLAVALGCAHAISRRLWRGVHDGRIAPVPLLLWATRPVWLLAEAVGQYLAQYQLRNGNPFGFAEASLLRIAGQFLAWGLAGSVTFGLAISAFLWRAPARRLPGLALAWASLAPLALFVAWVVATAQVESLAIRSGLVGYAWVSLPFVLGIAGAALGDDARAHPRPDWVLGVGVGALVVFVAAAAVATGQALVDAQVGPGDDYGALAASPAEAIAKAGRVAWLGLPLAALPLFAFIARLGRWPSMSAWGLVAVPLVLVAIAAAIAAAGPGPEHGLAAAYPRRRGLLLAYVVAAPLAILALRRVVGGHDAARDGLVVAVALFGLLWLAWRPGLLVLAPPSPASASHDGAMPLPSPEPEPTSPPPAIVVRDPAPPGVDGDPWTAEGPPEVGDVEIGDARGGLPGGIPGAPPAMATSPPAAELAVHATALGELRIGGEDVVPPPGLYAGAPRTTLTVVLHVDAGGSVSRVEVARSSGNPALDEHVRSALATWRFRPWMEQGRALPVRAPITFNFVNRP